MSEYLRIAQVTETKTKAGASIGSPMLIVQLADGSKVSCFDQKLFPAIVGKSAVQGTIDRSRPAYPKIIEAWEAKPSEAPNGTVAPTGEPDAKEGRIVREVALKAAVDAIVKMQVFDKEVSDAYTSAVLTLAASFERWITDGIPF